MRSTTVLLCLIGLLSLAACADRKEAQNYLGGFIAEFYPNAQVVASECQNVDSDGDGYVSCTVSLQNRVPCATNDTNEGGGKPVCYGETKLVSIECAASWPWQMSRWLMTGCRIPKMHAGG